MLTFFLTALVFAVCTACFFFVSFFTIQEGQIFGKWQQVLSRLRNSRKAAMRALAKPLGDCELCTAHLTAMVSFIVLLLFTGAPFAWYIGIVIYFLYVPAVTVLSMVLLKFFQK